MRRLRTTGNLVAHQLPAALCAAALLDRRRDDVFRGLDEPDDQCHDNIDDLRVHRFLRPPFEQIDCELDHKIRRPGAKPLAEPYRMSSIRSLLQNDRLSSAGLVKTCVGSPCGSNLGLGTLNLVARTCVRSGRFTCVIVSGKVNCAILNGKRFSIGLTTSKVFAVNWLLGPCNWRKATLGDLTPRSI